MDIYLKKSRWKLYLALLGLAIVVVSMLYTSNLARRLAVVEQNNARFWVMAQQDINDMDDEMSLYCDVTLQQEILTSNSTIPVLIVNEQGGIDDAVNWGGGLDTNFTYLQSQLEKLRNEGVEPIQSFGVQLYFGESRILRQLRFFPVVQFMLFGAFILFGYIGFNAARRAEQNRVWVGLAKETAHQLGTPITAIVGWIEHLKMAREGDEEVNDILQELNNDVSRLELIADRFSKIGSMPELKEVNLYTELDACREYMEKRAPRKVAFHFPAADEGEARVAVNPPLFAWVIENLLRNALDAMEGKGEISARVYEDGRHVCVDISDTGKGIPSGKFKTVFQPGYTTKKRGWGLGLSLAKRIVEQYHRGRIFVKHSEENKGTTFTISLPKP
jgi:two-component sensor histidine kinase